MQMTISGIESMVCQFEIRNVYGESKAYPANLLAEKIALIAGTKTLTRHTLQTVFEIGMTLEQVYRGTVVMSANKAQSALPALPL
jgi:hypothetical protein